MSFLQSIGPFVIVLGIIIFVHEFGHFITAKAFGMRVFIFSFGFGRRLIGFKRGDTDYRLSLIPLGGYVKLEGEPEDHLSEDTSTLGDGKDFTARPRWQKFLVYLAGPFMNAVLTIAVFTGLFRAGSGEVDATLFSPPVIGAVEADSPASRAGVQPGDEIVSVDGKRIDSWEDTMLAILIRPDADIRLGIRRGGVEQTLAVRSTARPHAEDASGKELVGHIGVSPVLLVKPLAGAPAAEAGVRAGDQLLRVDGRTIASFADLVEMVGASKGNTLRLELRRGSETLVIPVTPRQMAEGPRIGLGPHTVFKQFGLGGAFVEACRTTWQQTRLTFEVVKRLLTARLSPKTMMGPLGIGKKAGEEAQRGAAAFLQLIAMISLQVGILNLFPLAPLDGGHLAIIGVEGLIRRDLSLDVKAWIMNAGALVLLGLIVVVLYSDLSKTSALSKYLP
jgi:regulator of sigma E protease